MAKEMAKAYEPRLVEDAIYESWLKSGIFSPDASSGTETFSIVMPPPNVTGVLHLGHALENSLMDAMARYQRLLGKKVLLVPGTDHAALPTQAKVEKMLMADGMKNPRQELGREALVAKIRDFAEASKATILNQVKKMGTSADWSRLAYTFDEKRNVAVNELFTKMYNDGLIYRGFRVVNWSVKGQSTSSDDEIETIERPSVLYTFKYSKDFPIAISTTRPETKVGDTAVAVHPTDDRYKQFIGQTFDVDFAGSKLSIKIIASDAVDPAFGTGALGVTPAHSAIDFGMYEAQKAKQDPIEIVQVIGTDGKMTVDAGSLVVGQTVEEARATVVAWLSKQGLLEESKDIVQNVGTSDRYGDVIESIPMTQWWLDVNKEIPNRKKSLKDLMREAVTTGLNGDSNQKVSITPERFTKLYLDRVDNLRDWCLSRQIWWGHRIPAWYRGEEIFVGTSAPEGEGWVQDEDTLDTWFSSGSWTFSTLGWPEKTADLEAFHPTSWIQMGYEILYLWLMRMVLTSTYALREIPFKDAYIHGILRDKDGKKFSKSSGNGIDPIEVINQYGCDALRVSLLSGNTPGEDSRFYMEKVEAGRNLVNKIWNISRFIDLTTGGLRSEESPQLKTDWDKDILRSLNTTVKLVTDWYEEGNFSSAAVFLRGFTWNNFADEYIEVAKFQMKNPQLVESTCGVLLHILEKLLILWHPVMPFVTEEIYSRFNKKNKLIVAVWPEALRLDMKADWTMSVDDQAGLSVVSGVIASIRNIRNEQKIGPTVRLHVYLKSQSETTVAYLKKHEEYIGYITKSDLELEQSNSERMLSGTSRQVFDTTVFVMLPEVDVKKEQTRIVESLTETAKFIASQESKLANEDFVKRAPEKVIAGERQKLADLREKLAALQKEHAALVS